MTLDSKSLVGDPLHILSVTDDPTPHKSHTYVSPPHTRYLHLSLWVYGIYPCLPYPLYGPTRIPQSLYDTCVLYTCVRNYTCPSLHTFDTDLCRPLSPCN